MNKLPVPLWIQILLLCLVIVPSIAYLTGAVLVGDYEGVFGILGFLGSLYRDALRFEPIAWFFILSPLMIVGVWRLARGVRQRMN